MKSISARPGTTTRIFAYAMLCVGIACFIPACGGSSNRDQLKDEAAAATLATPTDANTSPANVEVLTSSSTLPSAGPAVTLTAFIKNASNVGLAGKAAVFSASSGTLEVVSATSDATGAVSAKLSAGSNKSARNITVTVTAGTASGTVVVAVTDSSVTAPAETSSTPSVVEVLTSSSTLPSAGSPITLTAFIKNASNVGLVGKSAIFAASSGILEVVSATSDASGAVTAKLSAGSNKSVRDITVTVAAGTASGSTVLAVSDTTVAVSGTGSMQVGAAASTYTVRAADSAGNPIAGAAMAVSSELGNSVSLTSPNTSGTGTTSFTYTPSKAGPDTLTVSGLGVQTKTTVQVNAIDFSVLSPPSNTTVAVGPTGQTVRVRFKKSNVGEPNLVVSFSSTRGSVTPNTATTDANGEATVQVTSATAGPATVVAQIAGEGQVTLPLLFSATIPSTVVVQSNPSAVQPNAVGSSNNQSAIEAVVRDANGNAVANTQVAFSVLQDLSNGNLSPGTATTDSTGRAQVQFIPGPTSTASNGVVIQAAAGVPQVTGTTTLTVNGKALFITIAFGNKLNEVDTTTYSMPLTAYVTDANGVAVSNQTLTLSILPEDYNKGSMSFSATSNLWASAPVATCPNEDSNRNGILDGGEDTSTNGLLTPGNVAVVVPGTVTTDTEGRASFAMQYGKPYATWVRVRIMARATVAGTESSQSLLMRLPIAITDITDANIPPPSVNSPFGQSAQCLDAL